jgi:hypothetical protein
MRDDRVLESGWRHVAERHGWWISTTAIYALIMTFTTAHSMGDTVDYANSVVGALSGGNHEFWEFGHLLWRPLGYISYRAASFLIEPQASSAREAPVTRILITWNWLSGLVGLLALNRFISRLGTTRWSVPVISLAGIVTLGVLNFAHSGSSYVPGLACMLVALALLANPNTMSAIVAITAGAVLALAVGFWALYILVIPALLVFPMIWFGLDRRRLRMTGFMAATFFLVLGSMYLLAIVRLRIQDAAGLRTWMTESSHDIVNIRGVSRMVFGIPRSFVSMDNDGIVFKRFLLKDPYNPVSLSDLIRLSLAKLALFYLVVVAILVGLLRGKAERRMLIVVIVAGLPVLAFGANWQGGDVERYMPVYPLVFAAWALVLGGPRPSRLIQVLVLSFLVVMSIVNLSALSIVPGEPNRNRTSKRVEQILSLLDPKDRVYVVTIQDRLFRANRDPLTPRSGSVKVRALIPLGHADAAKWRSSFASDLEKLWKKGGKVCSLVRHPLILRSF